MPLQVEEIQGIILRGYGGLDNARFLMLAIEDVALAKSWLKGLELRNSQKKPEIPETCTNIAFTAAGLRGSNARGRSAAPRRRPVQRRG